MDTDKTLTKIAALLRKAEGTDNEHEMAAFTEAAQRIATAAAIDIELARIANQNGSGPSLVQKTITVGARGTKGLKNYVQLFAVIANANDVQCDVLRDSTTVYAYGYSTDIAITEQLYQSLVIQMVNASEEYLQRHKKTSTTPKPSLITLRLNFHNAFAARIGTRLEQARKQAQKNYTQTGLDKKERDSTALVLQQKTDTIDAFYSTSSQARGAWRTTKSTFHAGAHAAGYAAGSKARMETEKNTRRLGFKKRQLGK